MGWPEAAASRLPSSGSPSPPPRPAPPEARARQPPAPRYASVRRGCAPASPRRSTTIVPPEKVPDVGSKRGAAGSEGPQRSARRVMRERSRPWGRREAGDSSRSAGGAASPRTERRGARAAGGGRRLAMEEGEGGGGAACVTLIPLRRRRRGGRGCPGCPVPRPAVPCEGARAQRPPRRGRCRLRPRSWGAGRLVGVAATGACSALPCPATPGPGPPPSPSAPVGSGAAAGGRGFVSGTCRERNARRKAKRPPAGQGSRPPPAALLPPLQRLVAVQAQARPIPPRRPPRAPLRRPPLPLPGLSIVGSTKPEEGGWMGAQKLEVCFSSLARNCFSAPRGSIRPLRGCFP